MRGVWMAIGTSLACAFWLSVGVGRGHGFAEPLMAVLLASMLITFAVASTGHSIVTNVERERQRLNHDFRAMMNAYLAERGERLADTDRSKPLHDREAS